MNKINLAKFYLWIITAITLIGCSDPKKAYIKEQNSLKVLPKHHTTGTNSLRLQMVRDTALTTGARGGLAFRTKKIHGVLAKYYELLDRIFNFRLLLVEHNVLPPVLIEAKNALQLNGPDLIRIADRHYQIVHQAKFVTNAPNWRDYLLKAFEEPELPDKSLLPKTNEEKEIWGKYIDKGWLEGEKQANLIFKENLNILIRDLKGMILYRKLLEQQMITPPFVSSVELGITGDRNSLTVNDRILKITAFPSLQADGNKWKTELKIHRGKNRE